MDFETYKGSLAEDAPPEGLSMAAQALWWEAKGDWHLAHQCAQKQADAEGAWVARLSAPRRRRSVECRRLVSPRRPPCLDRAVAGGVGDDRAGAIGLRPGLAGAASRCRADPRRRRTAAPVAAGEVLQAKASMTVLI